MIYIVKTGDKISIRLARVGEDRKDLRASDEGGLSSEFISQVEEVRGDSEVIAHVPIVYGRLTRLPETSRYNMVFHTSKGMVHYLAKIETYFQEDNIYLMKIRLLTKGEPIQNRKFFRFECNLPFKYNMIDEDDAPGTEAEVHMGTIRDLSGGGLCFQTNESIKVNQKIRCMMELGQDLLIIIGTVLRKSTPKNNPDTKFEYNIIYTGITESDKERVVKFIFREQREHLKLIR
jgi:c-di-GMP-binding flagellar brake protein YcgR